ncbi:unnamed protein product [Meloidogyne enterolobii]|uniref:Uncharacterized protein n=1 Tax=Meloidogyne enterolobii TaxID=390850 RepID=A0ACB0XN16_MELEN
MRELRRLITTGFNNINTRFNDVNTRFNDVNTRFDGIDASLNGLNQRFTGVNERLDILGQRVDTYREGLNLRCDVMTARLNNIDARCQCGVDQPVINANLVGNENLSNTQSSASSTPPSNFRLDYGGEGRGVRILPFQVSCHSKKSKCCSAAKTKVQFIEELADQSDNIILKPYNANIRSPDPDQAELFLRRILFYGGVLDKSLGEMPLDEYFAKALVIKNSCIGWKLVGVVDIPSKKLPAQVFYFDAEGVRKLIEQCDKITPIGRLDVGKLGKQARLQLTGTPPLRSNLVSVLDSQTKRVAILDLSAVCSGSSQQKQQNRYMLVCFDGDLDSQNIKDLDDLLTNVGANFMNLMEAGADAIMPALDFDQKRK